MWVSLRMYYWNLFIFILRIDVISLLDILLRMHEADREIEGSAGPVLTVYREGGRDGIERVGTRRLRDEEGTHEQEELRYVFDPWPLLMYVLTESRLSTFPNQQPAVTPSLLRRCYGSVRKLVTLRSRRRDEDVEAALTDGHRSVGGAVIELQAFMPRVPEDVHDAESCSDVNGDGDFDSAACTGAPSTSQRALAAFSVRSNSVPSRLLSDEENARVNRKVDRLMAAIDHRRPIHFAPDAQTGEVAVFAHPYDADEAIDQGTEREQLEQDIGALYESFGKGVRAGKSIRRIRSLSCLRRVDSAGSWVSTDSEASSSNAWERAVAAADTDFALEYGSRCLVQHVFRRWSHSTDTDSRSLLGRYVNRSVSPIPLDFDKPLRVSTPSIYSNGTELDNSSPLFRKSCQRVLQESYTEAPESIFQRETPRNSLLDEWAFVSEPREATSPEADLPETASSTGKVLGVFRDNASSKSSSKKLEKSALPSKALKDVSNLRRPGYLQFNSFAKDAKATANKAGTAAPTAPSKQSGNTTTITKSPPKLDGAARRRNEQAIGHPIDESLYSISAADIVIADIPPNAKKRRQRHFNLALARLEGRALPPSPSPIHRYPDSAALYDVDVSRAGGDRPLPIWWPRPGRIVDPTKGWIERDA